MAVVEELIHVGQHRRLRWGSYDRITAVRMEIEAQEKLLRVAKRLGWTADEQRAIAINRSYWKERLMKLVGEQ